MSYLGVTRLDVIKGAQLTFNNLNIRHISIIQEPEEPQNDKHLFSDPAPLSLLLLGETASEPQIGRSSLSLIFGALGFFPNSSELTINRKTYNLAGVFPTSVTTLTVMISLLSSV